MNQRDDLVRVRVADPNADQSVMHQSLLRDYEVVKQQLQAAREENRLLQREVDRQDGMLTLYQITSERNEALLRYSIDRAGIHTQTLQMRDHMPDNSTNPSISGNTGDTFYTGGDNSGVAGKDQTGVAGRDITGDLTITIDRLKQSPEPNAPKLADLLQQIRAAIAKPDAGLSEKDQEKALKHLEAIGQLGTDRTNPDLLEKAEDALDALPTILSRGAGLIQFCETHLPTFTAAIKGIFNWS